MSAVNESALAILASLGIMSLQPDGSWAINAERATFVIQATAQTDARIQASKSAGAVRWRRWKERQEQTGVSEGVSSSAQEAFVGASDRRLQDVGDSDFEPEQLTGTPVLPVVSGVPGPEYVNALNPGEYLNTTHSLFGEGEGGTGEEPSDLQVTPKRRPKIKPASDQDIATTLGVVPVDVQPTPDQLASARRMWSVFKGYGFEIKAQTDFWMMIARKWGSLDLEAQAHSIATWMNVKHPGSELSGSRITNWLIKAANEQAGRAYPANGATNGTNGVHGGELTYEAATRVLSNGRRVGPKHL